MGHATHGSGRDVKVIDYRVGDIVILNGWEEGGVIGRAAQIDTVNGSLTLDWPRAASPYKYGNPQTFSSLDARKATPNEIFVRLMVMMSDRKNKKSP